MCGKAVSAVGCCHCHDSHATTPPPLEHTHQACAAISGYGGYALRTTLPPSLPTQKAHTKSDLLFTAARQPHVLSMHSPSCRVKHSHHLPALDAALLRAPPNDHAVRAQRGEGVVAAGAGPLALNSQLLQHKPVTNSEAEQ